MTGPGEPPIPPPPEPAPPRPKAPPPPLTARAPRPAAVRIRGRLVVLAVGGAALVLAGAFAWAFVVQPELRREARGRDAAGPDAVADGAVRPAEAIAAGPGRYDALEGRLPPPRGARPETPAEPNLAAPAPVRSAPWTPPRVSDASTSPLAEARASALFFDAAPSPPAAPAAAPAETASPTRNPHVLTAPASPHALLAGTVLPGVLLTAVDTSRPGPVVAVVSQNVFDSVTGRHLLAPQGARLIGRHEGESAHGDRRAFLVWERLILPDGRSVRLDQEPGVDGQGAVGVPGETDRRLWPLAVAGLVTGAVTTLGEFARGGARDEDRGSLLGNVGDAAALQAAETGGRLIDRELQVRAVVRVRPGAPVRVLITRDLILEPYRP